MNLKDYLRKYRMEADEFAVSCDLSIGSVYRYLRGQKMYTRTARKIEKFTKGEVTVEELLKDDKHTK